MQNSIRSHTSRTEGLGRKDNLVLGVELLEDVVLNRAPQLRPVHALFQGRFEEEGHDDDGRGVDRHRHRDLAQVDAVEECLHVIERIDGDAKPAHFAKRTRIVGVQAHERGQIEGGAQAGLALVKQELEALIGLPGGAEARELPHGPELAAVHGSMDAARERILAGIAEIGVGIEADRARLSGV